MTTPTDPPTLPDPMPEAPIAAEAAEPGHGIGLESTEPKPAGWWRRLRGREPKTWQVVVLTTIAAIPCLAWWGNSVVNGDGPDRSGNAITACKDAVLDRLVSPSSADFSGLSADGSGGSWVVTGTVDSDNALGASIRNTFRCEYSGGRVTSLTGLTR